MEFTCESLDQLPDIAEKILPLLGVNKVVLFRGGMGVGKTTLIKEMCLAMGVEDSMSSPTFSLVNEYLSHDGPLYHFDFYRIKEEEEALDMGYEEYFYSGNYCFVEWPEKIKGLLPQDFSEIQIEEVDSVRIIKVSG